MAYFSLLIITILTVASTGAAPIYCSDVQSPASGSHNTNLSQVISLQYCIIDNCTIMKIDTGEQLDIVYTTESILIVTPVNGLTSMAIVKVDDKLSCLKYHNRNESSQLIGLVMAFTVAFLIMMTSIYIIIIHLLFKELRTLFGKLLIFHNLSILSTCISFTTLLFTHRLIIVNSQIICHTIIICQYLSTAGTEVFATTILTHLAYTMYRCYHLKSEISDKNIKLLFRYYSAYALITLILLFFVIIAYDWRTGNGRYTLLPNGHCDVGEQSYGTLYLVEAFNVLNKFGQIAMFLVYLVYFYKLKMAFHEAENLAQYSRKLFRIAIAMGANVGLSRFIWLLFSFHPEYSEIITICGIILFLMQQIVIMASFMCTRRMSELCKSYFSSD